MSQSLTSITVTRDVAAELRQLKLDLERAQQRRVTLVEVIRLLLAGRREAGQ